MTREDIYNKVAEILEDTFEISREDITPEALIHDDLDLDSIDAVDLIVELQQYINKNVDPVDFKQVKSVNDVVNVIEKLISDPAVAE